MVLKLPAYLSNPEAIKPAFAQRAFADLGLAEIPGDKDNPRIVEYFKRTGLTGAAYDNDETPWCAAAVNCWLSEGGQPGTGSAMAKSFRKYPMALRTFVLFCITVMNRAGGKPEDPQGHVGLYLGHNAAKDKVLILGGNQGNRVSIEAFPVERICDLRWPRSLPILPAWVGRIQFEAEAPENKTDR